MVNFILGALTAFFPTFVMWQLHLEKAYVPEEWIDKEESSGKYWTSIAVQTAAMVLVGFLSFANGVQTAAVVLVGFLSFANGPFS